MAREMGFRQTVWFDNNIANIEYIKQVDIFRESSVFDICTDVLAELPGFHEFVNRRMCIS